MRLVARNKKTGAVILAMGCLPLLLVLSFWSAVFYVAIHFISKFW